MKTKINRHPSIKAHLLPSLFILLSLLVIGSTVARALQLSSGSQSQDPASAGAVGAFAPSAQAGVVAAPSGGITAIRAREAPNDPAAAETTWRVSISSDGEQGNNFSELPSTSADGRYVAFHSDASNLVQGDTNGVGDEFVYDRQTGQTTRVSVSSGGEQGNARSKKSSMSASARYVAFYSEASNLVQGDTNGAIDIFVHDRQTGQTTRVSVSSGGEQANSFSDYPSISADGRYIAFHSGANNLVQGDTNGAFDVFVHDRQTGETARLSVSSGGEQGNGPSGQASISADGRYVAFFSVASNLVQGDTNGVPDGFVHDRQTGETTRVSVSSGGEQGNGPSVFPSISADGRHVAFHSNASNLVQGDTNGAFDVFVHDRQTGQTTRLSISSGGQQGNSGSGAASISADGRYVAFFSEASNVVLGDTNGSSDVFVHDRQTAETARVSVSSGGEQGNGASNGSSISPDGRYVAFTSDASNLVQGDTNGWADVLVHLRSPSPVTQAINLSTRLLVQTGDGVGIGGFIVTGTTPKHVLIRALGPSLSHFGIPNPLANPVVELHGPGAFATITNDNWRDTQEAAIVATGLPPTDDLESAIDATLAPGNYTAVVRGKNNATGVGLVEVYDISQAVTSKLANISTRAFVGTGDNIVIAGFVLGNNGGDGRMLIHGDGRVLIRGLGPSLSGFGLPAAHLLADPTLELRDSNGALLISNNDWQDSPSQAAEISAAGLAPSNPKEAAIAAMLPSNVYTALMAGLNNTTGIGLIEVYDRNAAPAGTPAPTPTPGPTGTPGPTSTPGPTATPGGTATPAPTATPVPTATPTPAPPCTENFDSLTAPNIPAGWTSTSQGAPPDNGIKWVTSTVTPDSAPNDAFVDDQNGVSDKYLTTRNIVVGTGATLTFRNSFNTEADVDGFWDGGVLEVSSTDINGGAFTDITDPAVGGSFTSGGYTGELRSDAQNPLAGRMAWSGDSGGYITTVANLGPNVNGRTIKLRFRMGTDLFASRPGWRIDTLVFTNASCQ